MILITGATGHLGKAVVALALKKLSPSKVAVLVRDPAKVPDLKTLGVDVRQGDYSDYASLVKAFKGVDKLYFVSSSDVPNRVPQHLNVVKAAKEAGVNHIIYTSFQRKDESATSPIAMVAEAHLKTEAAMKDSGLAYTILKHGLYMDYIPVFIGDKVLETGVICQPAGNGKTAWTLREDMAAVGVQVLTTDGHENKVYEIAAAKAYSWEEVAKIISKVSGKTITYVSPTTEEFIKTLSEAGVPTMYVHMFAGFAEAIKQGDLAEGSDTVEKLIGRKTADIEDYLDSVYGRKK